jgi:hypothetical protein
MSFIDEFIGLSPGARDACLEFSETHWAVLMSEFENDEEEDEAQEHAQDAEADEAQGQGEDQAFNYVEYLQRYPKRSPIFWAIFLLSQDPQYSCFLSRAEEFLQYSPTDQLPVLVKMLQFGFKECGLTGIFDPDHNQHLLFEALTTLFIDGLNCIYGDDDVSLKLKNQYRDFMLSLIHAPGIFDYIFLAFPAQCGEEMLSLLIQSQDRDLLSAVLMKLYRCLGQTFTLNQLNPDEKILILPEDYGLDDGGELAEDFSLEISELSVSKASWSLKSILRYLLKHGDQDQLVSQFFYSTIKNVRACSFPLSHFIFSPAVGGIEIFSNAERLKIASLSPETRQLAHAFCKSCIVQDGTSIDITMLVQTLLESQQKTRLENIRSSVRDAQDYKAARAVCPSVVVTGHLSQSEKGQLESEYQAAIELLKQDIWPSVLLSQLIERYLNRTFEGAAQSFIAKERCYWASQFKDDIDFETLLSFQTHFETCDLTDLPKLDQDTLDAVCREWYTMFAEIFDSKGRDDLGGIFKSLQLIVAGHEGQTDRFLRDCIRKFSDNVNEMQRDGACSPPFDRVESPVPEACYAPPASLRVVDTTATIEVEAAQAGRLAQLKAAKQPTESRLGSVSSSEFKAAVAAPSSMTEDLRDIDAAQAVRLAQLNLNQ